MACPFPGMDPFIEGQEWEDFHHHFIEDVHNTLVPQVRPRYAVRVEKRIYVEHHPEELPKSIRPDVAVVTDRLDTPAREEVAHAGSAVATSVAPVLMSVPVPEQQREAFLTVRLRDSMEVVTVIEVLSPANKRSGADGHREYLGKRESVLGSRTHLVELDLLRGGRRLPTNEPLPPADYYAFVCRGQRRPQVEVYTWALRHRLPRIPVPLAGDDPDATLDLQALLASVYDRAGYDYSLDHRGDVEPPLGENDLAWARSLVAG